jgi:hypothetical protein
LRCFYVLVHGSLTWECESDVDDDSFQPAGFYCHRYVLAKGYEDAANKAIRRVRKNLERKTGWLKQGLAELALEAEELKPAPMYKLLKRRPGHAFYDSEGAVEAKEVVIEAATGPE